MELSVHFDYFILTFAKYDLASVESTYICVESLVQIKPKLKKVFLTSDPQ
jgi:hypothetical protein